MGWRARITRLPDPADPDYLATITVHAHTPDRVNMMLAEAIPRRRTDRRHYSFRPASAADIGLMEARAARLGVTLQRVT